VVFLKRDWAYSLWNLPAAYF